MEASWRYVSRLAQRSEQIGYDLTLIAELNLKKLEQQVSLEDYSVSNRGLKSGW